MAYRLVRGDLLMHKMLMEAQTAVSVLRQAVPGDAATGVIGHSMGGTVALFLGALDPRIDMTCASGAVASYRARMARGIGLEMAQVMPGFVQPSSVGAMMSRPAKAAHWTRNYECCCC